ncbi:MAG: FAD-dependent oxidoreductase, partial [Planctomycetes bacterium]|nr:FAD-dependent oxidoreductase [Planctomycetota bacterium]
MPIVVRNISLQLGEPEELVLDRVVSRLGITAADVRHHAIVRRSLDARKHDDIHFVYSVELTLAGGVAAEDQCIRRRRNRNIERIVQKPVKVVDPGTAGLSHRPVIVGFGPAGMFAALRLAELGYCPIVLERGKSVRQRHKDIMQTFYRDRRFNPESNLLYGEGGAGTYSDGKVYTRVSDPAVREVLATFVRFGASPDLLIDAKPHIGSDRLPTICSHMQEHIKRCGGEVRFESRLDDLQIDDGTLSRVIVNGEGEACGPVLLAIGHSARDTYAMLQKRHVELEARPFQFGVRIEHPQSMVNRWQYGDHAAHPCLPTADYQVNAKGAAGGKNDVFSFCMCPGGVILPTNESEGLIATNGASRASRGGEFANSGFVVTLDPKMFGSDPLAGLDFQREWESKAFAATDGSYSVPAQRCEDFMGDTHSNGELKTSYPLGGKWCSISQLLPDSVAKALKVALPMLDRKMPGFAGLEGIITAPESRA